MGRRDTLSAAAARRIALAAQGFARPRPALPPTPAQALREIDRLGLVQIDSVSAVVRSHYLPLFSRLGPYPCGLLDQLAYDGRRRKLFEYWGHEASLIPVRLQPMLRWRMARAGAGQGTYGQLARFARDRRGYVDDVLAEVRIRGALGAGDLADGSRGQGGWWGWSDGKTALEFLFWAGAVTTATRRGFERIYDLPERVLPKPVLALPTPEPAEAQRALLLHAGRALGVATARDLRDYFRLDAADVPARLAELVEAGQLLPVTVEGWAQPAYLDPAARAAAPGRRARPAVAVQLAGVGARAHRADLRLPLPAGDLHAGAQADPRLLRAAVPAGRSAGGPRRPQDRSPGGLPARAGDALGAGRGRAGDRRSAGGGAAADGGVARAGPGGHRPALAIGSPAHQYTIIS